MTAPADRTRQRILDAATEEFAARGIAGARVDRIAQASGMSKPMLYSHFGGKDRLFDVVFAEHVIANGDRVPFTADDLPGYAARLYDDYLADPALARLVMWKRLERDGIGYLYPGPRGTTRSTGATSWPRRRHAPSARTSIPTTCGPCSSRRRRAGRRSRSRRSRRRTTRPPCTPGVARLAAHVRDGLCAGGATTG